MRQEKTDVRRKKAGVLFQFQTGFGQTILFCSSQAFFLVSRGSRAYLVEGLNPGRHFLLTVIRQKCRLTLTVKKFQGTSSPTLLAHLHGLLSPEEALNWKNQFHIQPHPRWTLQDLNHNLLTTEIIWKFYKWRKAKKTSKTQQLILICTDANKDDDVSTVPRLFQVQK